MRHTTHGRLDYSVSQHKSVYLTSLDPQDIVLIQIKNILAPGVADPHGHWHSCKMDINNCSSNQLDLMQGQYSVLKFLSHDENNANFVIIGCDITALI